MTPVKAVASSLAVSLVILGLAVASNALLDRYLPRALTAASDADATAPDSPCIDANGQTRNWPWPNAPTLWPRCKDDAPPPAAAKKEN